jgi:hypothetical protein
VTAEPAPDPPQVPRVPGYAWDWLQRSRPVVEALAALLTGQPPRAGFVQAVRRSFADDQLVRDAVYSVVADVAFHGRVPQARPPGVSWDRGLVWWAATLAGRSVTQYEDVGHVVDQPQLFSEPTPAGSERRVLIQELRELLLHSDGDQIPASAVRQLIARLEKRAASEGEAL